MLDARLLTDEHVMRGTSRQWRQALRSIYGKCRGCGWPANTICTRDHCPQGVAVARAHLAELFSQRNRDPGSLP